ncbi:MepB family protein [Streptomyces sp. LP11]|uniref:MepB family protein n=1 Tax=Streptomyces pyxinicus TaxID=2970331 RepID=A0ABT2AYV8_9ACTN|nr:MepB family protein [Streptomyces sp. LP11]MCS0601444.1 MepB family protein [Streptomyces sp. LP11]
MVVQQPWAGLHSDLLAAKALVYDPSGFACSLPVPVPEPESAEYAACAFTLRSEEGPIRPFDVGDGVDLFVISSRDDDGFGQFVFPRDVLCERGIVSRGGSGGKRGFRVYPPWVTTANRQARATQAWQVNYFLDLGRPGTADLARAHTPYHP